MPKMKTNKSVASRFRLTATGKLKRQHQGRRHKLSKKSSQQKRQLQKSGLVHETKLKMYKRMLGV